MSEAIYNFSSGPAMIPRAVLEQAQRELLELPGVGLSVLEISHRSSWADEIFERAEVGLRQLLEVPDDYHVLFLQGGGNLQFSMVPINFLVGAASADYLLTGHWGSKAVLEARREGSARLAWSGEGTGFDRVPEASELDLDPDAAYLHVTANETIQGVQFPQDPLHDVELHGVPLVCDVSSEFLSRPMNVRHYGLLYACAQKNAGPAGLTVVVISEELLARRKGELHSMLDYGKHAAAGSRYNTPPVFAVYLFDLVLQWITREFGDLRTLEQHNRDKAAVLYAALQRHSDIYRLHAKEGSRSLMNVTFRTPSSALDDEFLAAAGERRLVQLRGHRSVGGMRASIYNAMPLAGVERLAELVSDFAIQLGGERVHAAAEL